VRGLGVYGVVGKYVSCWREEMLGDEESRNVGAGTTE